MGSYRCTEQQSNSKEINCLLLFLSTSRSASMGTIFILDEVNIISDQIFRKQHLAATSSKMLKQIFCFFYYHKSPNKK